MSELIKMRVENQLGHIVLNRPDKLNSLSSELIEAVKTALKEMDQNREVKAIILSAEGRSFCAGGDIDTMRNLEHVSEIAKWIELASSLSKALIESDKYVISAVHGFAAGAGFSVALASDFIIADKEAKFALSFTNIGLIPDLGLIKSLSERVPLAIAKEWISSGKVITAEEAYSKGIVNRIAEGNVVEEAIKFADFIIKGPQVSNKYVKYLLNHSKDLHLEAAFMQENIIQALLLQTQDHKEGISAFFEKRVPDFKGL
ncbi:MAG TPA: enoyl-CoA hydratase/isomerase family protein [Chondromyces sp.]|nr:enoyl-CoA hydratase/isomerase family protein [Chondromyces sp.]